MKRFFKISLRFFVGLFILGVLGLGTLYILYHESLPEGKEGPEAEAMADRMLEAVNADAWSEVRYLSWGFPRGHDFVWDRQRNKVQVEWDDHRAQLDAETGKGLVFEKGEPVLGTDADETLKTAQNYFWNDSFWLLAFLKVRDPGTVRSVVDLENGEKGLLVTYQSGGSTPGDSYLWQLGPDGRPTSWKMWVNIIPIGGLEFTWENWKQTPNGAWYAPMHDGSLLDVEITNVRTANSLEELKLPANLFQNI